MQKKWLVIRILLPAALAHVGTPSGAAENGCPELPNLDVPEIQAALDNQECRASEYLQHMPDMQGKKLKGLSLLFNPTTRAFRGQPRQEFITHQRILVDANWVKGLHQRQAQNSKPNGCDAVSLSNYAYSVTAKGELHAQVQIDYQEMLCTDSTCYVGIRRNDWGIPYPKFEKCTLKTDIPGGDARVIVHTYMEPVLIPLDDGTAEIEIRTRNQVQEVKRVSNALVNIVGAMTLGIGSKYIRDQYQHGIDDLRASLPNMQIGFVTLPRVHRVDPQVQFSLQPPKFVSDATGIGFAFEMQTQQSCSVTAGIRSKAIQAQKFFQSCAAPVESYVTQPGDSLWTIAEALYGDGQYYHVIAGANPTVDPNKSLLPDTTLQVPPYFRLVGEDYELVQAGDTLWDIAKRRLGDSSRYPELRATNGASLDPLKLPSLVTLRVSETAETTVSTNLPTTGAR